MFSISRDQRVPPYNGNGVVAISVQQAPGAKNVGAGLRPAYAQQPGPYHTGLTVHTKVVLLASPGCQA